MLPIWPIWRWMRTTRSAALAGYGGGRRKRNGTELNIWPMTMSALLSARSIPRYFEPGEWLGAPFACPWLDASASVTDSEVTGQPEQLRRLRGDQRSR